MTEDEALALARKLCGEQGWPWLEPVKIEEKGDSWLVYTNASARGANVRVLIRRVDGQVLEAAYLPR